MVTADKTVYSNVTIMSCFIGGGARAPPPPPPLFFFFFLLFLGNLDGFLQSIAYMNEVPFGRNYQFSDYITLQVTVSSVFNNTAKLHIKLRQSMRSSTSVNDRSVNFLIKTEP